MIWLSGLISVVVILLFKEALAVPRALALFANVCSDSCNQQGRRPLWGLCAGKELAVAVGRWVLGGVLGGRGSPVWATASCHQKSSFHGTTWSPTGNTPPLIWVSWWVCFLGAGQFERWWNTEEEETHSILFPVTFRWATAKQKWWFSCQLTNSWTEKTPRNSSVSFIEVMRLIDTRQCSWFVSKWMTLINGSILVSPLTLRASIQFLLSLEFQYQNRSHLMRFWPSFCFFLSERETLAKSKH